MNKSITVLLVFVVTAYATLLCGNILFGVKLLLALGHD
jgi:hypothetical protein